MDTEESKISNAVEDLDRELEERLHAGRRRNRKAPRDKPPKGRKNILPVLTGLGILIVFVLLVLAFIGNRKGMIPYDDQAEAMAEEALSKETLRQELQDQANGSYFRVVMNTAPVSEDGQSADWCIRNAETNSYDMQVVVTLEDGTKIYQSEILAPGEESLTGELEQTLEAGSYPATGVAHALNRETGEIIGEVTVDLTLTVGDTK